MAERMLLQRETDRRSRPLVPAQIQDALLIVDGPAGGAWNMAVDEAMLESVAGGGAPVLRFYRWSRPVLSLGYFQRYEEALENLPAPDIEIVRRLSGGGAILHDHEITYSLAVPKRNPLCRDATALYHHVHNAMANALQCAGVAGELRAVTAANGARPQTNTSEPFYCFLRASQGDLLFEGRKVCGSAQRKRRGALLQHGSLILAASEQLGAIAGIGTGKLTVGGPDDLMSLLIQHVARALRLRLRPGGLQGRQCRSAERLSQARYGNTAWTRRR